MQRVELFVLLTIVGALIIELAIRGRRTEGVSRVAVNVAVGLTVGLFGALLVLVQSTDLVPDGVEQTVGPIVVVGITIAVVAGSIYRFAR